MVDVDYKPGIITDQILRDIKWQQSLKLKAEQRDSVAKKNKNFK